MVNLAILVLPGPMQANTMLWPMQISDNQVCVGPH